MINCLKISPTYLSAFGSKKMVGMLVTLGQALLVSSIDDESERVVTG